MPNIKMWKTSATIFLNSSYLVLLVCLTPFLEIVWIDKLLKVKEFDSLTMVAMETEKGKFSVFIAMVATRKKCDINWHSKNELTGYVLCKKRCRNQ